MGGIIAVRVRLEDGIIFFAMRLLRASLLKILLLQRVMHKLLELKKVNIKWVMLSKFI